MDVLTWTIFLFARHVRGDNVCSVVAPRFVKFVSKLNNIVANEGKDAIFKCSVTPADVGVRWLYNNVPVTAGPKFKIAHGGTSHSLTITAVTLEDVGEISVDAEGKVCKATLQVQSKTGSNLASFFLYRPGEWFCDWGALCNNQITFTNVCIA